MDITDKRGLKKRNGIYCFLLLNKKTSVFRPQRRSVESYFGPGLPCNADWLLCQSFLFIQSKGLEFAW